MYSPTFQTVIADARIDALRRARGTSIQPHRNDSNRRPATRRGLFSSAGIRRLVSADPSRAN